MSAAQKRRRSKEEWVALIAKFEASGQTTKQFAREHDLNTGTFKWWRTQLRRAARKARGEPSPPPQQKKKKAPKKKATKVRAAKKAPKQASANQASTGPRELPSMTERLVDRLVIQPGLTCSALSLEIRYGRDAVMGELRDLESLGIVYRVVGGVEARWYLG